MCTLLDERTAEADYAQRRTTALLSATLHARLGSLASLSLKDPAAIGFEYDLVDGQMVVRKAPGQQQQALVAGAAGGGDAAAWAAATAAAGGSAGAAGAAGPAGAAGDLEQFEIPAQLRQRFVEVSEGCCCCCGSSRPAVPVAWCVPVCAGGMVSVGGMVCWHLHWHVCSSVMRLVRQQLETAAIATLPLLPVYHSAGALQAAAGGAGSSAARPPGGRPRQLQDGGVPLDYRQRRILPLRGVVVIGVVVREGWCRGAAEQTRNSTTSPACWNGG